MTFDEDELVNWNSILENVLTDTRSLVKDLLEGINYILGAGIILVLLGLAVLYYNIKYIQPSNQSNWLILLAVTGSNFVIGFINIRKYFVLRTRYKALYELQRKINI